MSTYSTASDVASALDEHASAGDAANLSWFFKTGPGEYGEGDQFIGVRVPTIRKICKSFANLDLKELKKLVASPIHEHRLAATIIMSTQYKKANEHHRKDLLDTYLWALDNRHINNWDIVDTSCEHIVGAYAKKYDDSILFDLAANSGLWHKRVAIISCFAWVRKGEIGPTMTLIDELWAENHDLLQKAVGWMLRELGKRIGEDILIEFLDLHAHELPRTCLRYSIERLDPARRKYYMEAKQRIITT